MPSGEAEVADEQIGGFGGDGGEGGFDTVGFEDGVAFGGQEPRHELGGIGMVLDEENLHGARGGTRWTGIEGGLWSIAAGGELSEEGGAKGAVQP